LEIVDGELDVGSPSHGEEVEDLMEYVKNLSSALKDGTYCIRRATKDGDDGNGIQE